MGVNAPLLFFLGVITVVSIALSLFAIILILRSVRNNFSALFARFFTLLFGGLLLSLIHLGYTRVYSFIPGEFILHVQIFIGVVVVVGVLVVYNNLDGGDDDDDFWNTNSWSFTKARLRNLVPEGVVVGKGQDFNSYGYDLPPTFEQYEEQERNRERPFCEDNYLAPLFDPEPQDEDNGDEHHFLH